jgi:hypothetical protein
MIGHRRMVGKDDDARDTDGKSGILFSRTVQSVGLDLKTPDIPRVEEGDPPQLHLIGVEHDNPNGVSQASQSNLRVSRP